MAAACLTKEAIDLKGFFVQNLRVFLCNFNGIYIGFMLELF